MHPPIETQHTEAVVEPRVRRVLGLVGTLDTIERGKRDSLGNVKAPVGSECDARQCVSDDEFENTCDDHENSAHAIPHSAMIPSAHDLSPEQRMTYICPVIFEPVVPLHSINDAHKGPKEIAKPRRPLRWISIRLRSYLAHSQW